MSQWLILHTPDGVWCADLGDPGPDELERLLNAARVATGFPANDDWVADGSDWDIQLGGPPPPSVLETATVASAADLEAVDRTAVAKHAEARRTAARQAQVIDVQAMLASLDSDVLARVLADPQLATAVETATRTATEEAEL